jgi:hypothetical protein
MLFPPNVERAQVKFIFGFTRNRFQQHECRVRILLPNGEVFCRYRKPSKPRHVAAWFGHSSDLGPVTLLRTIPFPIRSFIARPAIPTVNRKVKRPGSSRI